MDILRPKEEEQAIIGILLSGKVEGKAIQTLSPDDFEAPDLRLLFIAICDIMRRNEGVTLSGVDEWLTRKYDTAHVGQIMAQAIGLQGKHRLDGWRLPQCVNMVQEAARRRRLVKAGEALSRGAADGTRDFAELLDNAKACLRGQSQSRFTWISLADACIDAYNAAEKQVKPFPTGIGTLDKVLCGGLHKGEFTILGARPAVGKSAVLLHMAQAAAATGAKVAFVSLEMSPLQIGGRTLAAKSDINPGLLRTGCKLPDESWAELAEALAAVGGDLGDNLKLLACGGVTVEELCAEVQTLADDGACEVLFVDYLQLLRSRQHVRGEYERLGVVSRGLKSLTLDLDIAVVAAAQVRRQDNGGIPRAPSMDELRGSGDMEQDADNILLLHTPVTPDDNTLNSYSYTEQFNGLFERLAGSDFRLLSVDVSKQRQGRTCRTWSVFNPTRMTFVSPERFMQ